MLASVIQDRIKTPHGFRVLSVSVDPELRVSVVLQEDMREWFDHEEKHRGAYTQTVRVNCGPLYERVNCGPLYDRTRLGLVEKDIHSVQRAVDFAAEQLREKICSFRREDR